MASATGAGVGSGAVAEGVAPVSETTAVVAGGVGSVVPALASVAGGGTGMGSVFSLDMVSAVVQGIRVV